MRGGTPDGMGPRGDGRGSERDPSSPGSEGGPPSDPSLLDRFKEFGLTSFAVAHRTSVLVLFLIIAIGGVLAYRSIPKESAPEIEIPMVAVNTVYAGVAPADIETLITREIEDELNTIADVEEITSTSVEGYSSVVVEFSTAVDLDNAIQKVREKVDLAKPDLPEDAEEPQILEFNVSEQPIMQVNLSGEYGLVRLKEIGEELQDRLEQISTVLRVDLRGGREREVRVEVDLERLKFYNLAFDDVVEAIREEHVNIPGGSIDVGTRKFLVRVDGEFEDPALISNVVVSVGNRRPVYVRDVASVDFGFADRESFARLGGNPVVTLDVIKRSGENIIATADAVKAAIEEMEPLFPPTTVVQITSDMSEDIHMMVSSLENNIISGLLLILAVLLFFLGVRNAGFVATAIPTSMLLSFLVLKALGITMNMVVLFSLILALGMLVDNAIVVVENIYRYVEEGWDRTLAARKATGEVAVPVIAATLTTLAAFFPLLFWPGMVGEFMKFLPITLIVTLASSLFVALVIIPTLCAIFMRVESAEGAREEKSRRLPVVTRVLLGLAAVGFLGFLVQVNPLSATLLVATAVLVVVLHRAVLARAERVFQTRWLPEIVHRYEGSLRWSLNHRLVTILASVAVLGGSIAVFLEFNHGVEFFPEDIPPAVIMVDVEAAEGSRVEFTNRIAERLEGELPVVEGFDDVESVVTTVGGTGGGGNPFASGGPSGPHMARLTISMVDYQDRSRDAFETLANFQSEVGTDVAGADVRITKFEEGPATGPPVNVEIVGEDPVLLKRLSDEVLEILRNAPVAAKLTGLESDMERGRPELSVVVDREKAQLYGLSTFDVANAVRGAVQGIEAAKYRTADEEYDIVVRLRQEDRAALSSLGELTVMNEGIQVPLLSMADWTIGEGYSSIRRKDLERMVTVSSDVRSGYNSNAVLAEVRETLTGFQADRLPPGYTMDYTGESEDQAESFAFLSTAFVMALALIGLILVSQFNSVIKPVIILTSVIMSTAGVLLGLVVFDMPFVIIMTGVGVISLAGIVVNNAIVLIDYIDILRERDGMNRREALVQGGKTRLRPVVLTALTTALGLIPLAIGLNFDFFGLYRSLSPEFYWGGEQASWWGPMAVAVIVGILFATFLTLILVPVMYSLVDDVMHLFKRTFLGHDEEVWYGHDPTNGGRTTPEEEEKSDGTPAPRPAGEREREPAPVFTTAHRGPGHRGSIDPRPGRA